MNNQIETCNEYLNLLIAKKDIIVIGDIQRLDEIVKQEQPIIMKMESMDNKRQTILKKIKLENLSMSEIINNYIEIQYKKDFEDAYEKLNETINSVKKAIFINQRLLKQRLSVVDTVLKTLENDPNASKIARKGTGKPFINFIKRA